MQSAVTPKEPTPAPLTARGEFRVLGVRVHAVQIPEVIEQMEVWIARRAAGRYIAVTGMHGVSESLDDPKLRDILNAADLVVPDGMSLVWVGRLRGCDLQRRVYGPELMETFCASTGSRYRHFFYGGGPGVAERIAAAERDRNGIQIAGIYTPPFRPLTADEETEVAALVEASQADVLWVGLSTPKQERWMYEHRNSLKVPVMAGVGAAFDLNSGTLVQAPKWMRENGLEWLFRLLAEPKRLWRRYLIKGSRFVWNVALETFRIRKFN
jgi:N-acetylglucosaminyldiphosphoundecaprenol N-acetyl-beta-D-mannosaminyltransferase